MQEQSPSRTITPDIPLIPPILVSWLAVFQPCFTAPTFQHVLVLVAGAVLAPGKRTVSQALQVMGLGEHAGFARYHEVLNRARWDGRALARRLLLHLLDKLLPDGPVVIGIDDTIERRWGSKITALGVYRDPVRSTKGQIVKTTGLRWLSLMLVLPIPWAKSHWALPFLTVLAPSQGWSAAHRRRHKSLTDWARQAILQTKRWLPNRRLIVVADSSFAAFDLLDAVRRRVCVVTRLRLDARLYETAPPRPLRGRGRPALKGKALPKLTTVLKDPATTWLPVVVAQWYGSRQRTLLTATGTAIWYKAGLPPVPIRWVLVRDPTGEHDPSAFLCTDLHATPEAILGWFVLRWRLETTFQEVREHLGVETQRQWSDRAILRTTPVLLGLFSLVTVWANELAQRAALPIRPHATAWYSKQEPTFSDAIAAVRRTLWAPPDFLSSRESDETVKIPARWLNRLVQTLCLAA